MSSTESVENLENIAASPVKQMIYDGVKWVQQVPDGAKKIVQQFQQASPKVMDPVNPNMQFYAGTKSIPQCEVCLTNHTILVWVIIIAITSIILWHLLFVVGEWILEIWNRPKMTQGQFDQRYNQGQQQQQQQQQQQYGQMNDRDEFERWKNQNNGNRHGNNPPNNGGFDNRFN